MVLQSIKYQRGTLQILDQLRLPHEKVYVPIKSPRDGWNAIISMQVRGAPAIAIVAALSLAVYVTSQDFIWSASKSESVAYHISQSLKYLATSRPTAVNLLNAAKKLEKIAWTAQRRPGANRDSVCNAYLEAAEQMLRDDVQDNESIGKYGAEWIEKHCHDTLAEGKLSVITHCNTGSLATAGYGTALGMIRSLHFRGSLGHIFYTETRPYNQGARLTGFELLHDNIPAQLITDSMAGYLLATRKQSDRISCIIVGADRVAANGDTANKVGTYALAVLARFHHVKFLVAAPRTTIDLSTSSGADIVIEERPIREMTHVKGPEIQTWETGDIGFGPIKEIAIAPNGTQAWNPAFDITPAQLIDGIITEDGAVEKRPDGTFHFDGIFQDRSRETLVDRDLPDPNSDRLKTLSWDEVIRLKADQVDPWSKWVEDPR